MPVTILSPRARLAASLAVGFRTVMLAAALVVNVAWADAFAFPEGKNRGTLSTRTAVSAVAGGGAPELARSLVGHDVSRPHVKAQVATPQSTNSLSVGRRGGRQSSWFRRVSRHAPRYAPVIGPGLVLAEHIDMPRLWYSSRSVLAEQSPGRPAALAYWPARTTRPPPQHG